MSVMGSHSVSPTCEPDAAVAIDYHIVRRVELLALIAVQQHLTAHAAQIDLVDGRGIAATTLQQQQQCLSWVALIGACRMLRELAMANQCTACLLLQHAALSGLSVTAAVCMSNCMSNVCRSCT